MTPLEQAHTKDFKRLAEFGRQWRESMAKALADLNRRMVEAREARLRPSEETASMLRYRRQIQQERFIGLAFVRDEAARTRKELGL